METPGRSGFNNSEKGPCQQLKVYLQAVANGLAHPAMVKVNRGPQRTLWSAKGNILLQHNIVVYGGWWRKSETLVGETWFQYHLKIWKTIIVCSYQTKWSGVCLSTYRWLRPLPRTGLLLKCWLYCFWSLWHVYRSNNVKWVMAVL